MQRKGASCMGGVNTKHVLLVLMLFAHVRLCPSNSRMRACKRVCAHASQAIIQNQKLRPRNLGLSSVIRCMCTYAVETYIYWRRRLALPCIQVLQLQHGLEIPFSDYSVYTYINIYMNVYIQTPHPHTHTPTPTHIHTN